MLKTLANVNVRNIRIMTDRNDFSSTNFQGNSHIMDSVPSYYDETEMTSVEEPVSPSAQSDNNRQHFRAHLMDHSYAAQLLTQGKAQENSSSNTSHNTPINNQDNHRNPTMPENSATAYPVQQSESDPSMFEIQQQHMRVNSDFQKDRVVYGNIEAIKNLFDYVDQVKTMREQRAFCGVILAKALVIEAPGRYRKHHNYSSTDLNKSGNFGVVTSCVDRKTGKKFACKSQSLSSFRREEVEVVLQLTDNSRGARCLPTIYGVILDGNYIQILMEFIDITWSGMAQLYRNKEMPRDEKVLVDLLKQALHGLRHLQLHHIVHCDIKPENLGYTLEGKVKILDFGTVRLSEQRFTICGMTGHYMPPEACWSRSHVNSDTWSLACSIMYLITYTHPWWNVSQDQATVIKHIGKKPGDILHIVRFLQEYNHISAPLADLLLQMLIPEPDERITASEALKHGVFELIGGSNTPLNSLAPIDSGEVPTVVSIQSEESNIGGRNSHPDVVPVYARATAVQNYTRVGANTQILHQQHSHQYLPTPYGGGGNTPAIQQQQQLHNQSPYHNYQLQQSQHVAVGLQQQQQHQQQYGQIYFEPQSSGLFKQQAVGQTTVASNQLIHGVPLQHVNAELPLNPGESTGFNMILPQQILSSSVKSGSIELPLDLCQRYIRDHHGGNNMQGAYGGDMQSLGEQLAASSGYNSSSQNIMDVSIEVTHKTRVEQFKAPYSDTIEDIWPVLRDKVRRLTANERGVPELYENKRKIEQYCFHEMLAHDRRFTVVVLNE